MSRPILSLDLSPRPNRHIEVSVWRDVADVVAGAVLLLLVLVLVMVVFA